MKNYSRLALTGALICGILLAGDALLYFNNAKYLLGDGLLFFALAACLGYLLKQVNASNKAADS